MRVRLPQSNFACPPEVREYRAYQEHAYQPPMKAGDVLIFSEALTHGAPRGGRGRAVRWALAAEKGADSAELA